MKSDEADLCVEKIRQRFEQSVDSLDGATVSRITRMRYSAVERTAKKTGTGSWIPAGAVATAFLGLLVYNLLPQQFTDDKIFIDEIEIISELDFYEDLEFYEWLELYELPS